MKTEGWRPETDKGEGAGEKEGGGDEEKVAFAAGAICLHDSRTLRRYSVNFRTQEGRAS